MEALAWNDVDLVKNRIRLRGTKAESRDPHGVSLFIIAKLLGHRSTAMVERHYGHLAGSNFS
jgi:integrase